MATRKQRRRREKDKRHEYEFVYVDDEGNEVEPDPDDVKRPPKRTGSANGKAAKSTSARGRKTPQPPSWRRVAKRGAIFGPLFIGLVLVIGGKKMTLGSAIIQTAILMVFFVPFSYFLDSMVWRSYQKRSGQGPGAPAKR